MNQEPAKKVTMNDQKIRVNGAVSADMVEVVSHFQLDGVPESMEPYGNGHINRTCLVTTGTGHRYILQRISEAFDIPALMRNMSLVTEHLAKKVKDPRESLHLVPTDTGESYYRQESGSYRVFDFVEDSICLELPKTPEDFYNCALAFGLFQKQLADFPADTLAESIPDFHNTINRYRIFRETLAKDPLARAAGAEQEIAFALAREEEAGCLHRMRESGRLPLRVTHNDTKINNVMLENRSVYWIWIRLCPV